MKRTITIDPVTRIEGHATVFVDQADDGTIESARMVVNELRGFERILVGMQADRMPLVTARICGVCPSAHHLASAKALDAAAGVDPPPAAKLLRELLYMGHFIHSHALSLFVLQGPDLLLGLDCDPARRNIVGLLEAAPEVAKKAIRLRTLGQKINEMVGGRGVHSVTAVAGGISFQITSGRRQTLEKWIDEALTLAIELGSVAMTALLRQLELHPALLTKLSMPSLYMATVKDGKLNLYDGQLLVIDPEGKPIVQFPAERYAEYLSETVFDWSYMKPVHFVDEHRKEHVYRVNTLARLNCVDGIETPKAQEQLEQFRSEYGHPCHSTVMFSYARIIELIYACEKAKMIVSDPAIMGDNRVPVRGFLGRGIGHVEAPRGTLIHDYEIDEKGIVRSANLIVATQHNYAAINRTIHQAAETFLAGKHEDEALINGIEFGIRCYDPCLSCSTHAIGRMPLVVKVTRGGEVVRTARRKGM